MGESPCLYPDGRTRQSLRKNSELAYRVCESRYPQSCRLAFQYGEGGRYHHGYRRAIAQRRTCGPSQTNPAERRDEVLQWRSGGPGHDRVAGCSFIGRRKGMSLWKCLVGRSTVTNLVCGMLVCASSAAFGQSGSPALRGINGSWEAYPQRAAGLGPTTKGAIPAPAPVPEPPLKPEHLAKWKADQSRDAELTRKGLPPVTSGMACLPEGMPGMMQATFPMEVLETPGQVTIIQEAYNQVRRIYLNEKLLA